MTLSLNLKKIASLSLVAMCATVLLTACAHPNKEEKTTKKVENQTHSKLKLEDHTFSPEEKTATSIQYAVDAGKAKKKLSDEEIINKLKKEKVKIQVNYLDQNDQGVSFSSNEYKGFNSVYSDNKGVGSKWSVPETKGMRVVYQEKFKVDEHTHGEDHLHDSIEKTPEHDKQHPEETITSKINYDFETATSKDKAKIEKKLKPDDKGNYDIASIAKMVRQYRRTWKATTTSDNHEGEVTVVYTYPDTRPVADENGNLANKKVTVMTTQKFSLNKEKEFTPIDNSTVETIEIDKSAKA